ncbi:uridine nucleosidase 1-like [Diospyros lotus]|uniref:uridine nucleosidase 1-like n=1 Tax=Diospyros lotus TaxID=55363 RepID=UPI002256BA7E|nr:uridine nucleosidase 1-like [Diospyros lotus]
MASPVVSSSNGSVSVDGPKKIVIDADPGIDDSMAILMAFQSPELEILGFTTVFGNVTAETATLNALRLSEVANRSDIPVAEGCSEPLMGGKPTVVDYVHGKDGLGNITLNPETSDDVPLVPKSNNIEMAGPQFLVDTVAQHPGQVTVLALGPLTNLALALKWDTSFASNVKEIVILGGAFFALGNINPAAESNILQDPEAADIVFTSGANISVVGINITTQVKLTDEELQDIRNSNGKYAKIVTDMCVFYEAWTEKSDKFKGIFLHDPTCFVSLVRPDLFTYTQGVVRVQIEGKCRGLTLLDPGQKEWNSDNAWTVEVDGVGKPIVSVAMAAQVDEIRDYVKNLLMQP